jgi:hypothetical protein
MATSFCLKKMPASLCCVVLCADVVCMQRIHQVVQQTSRLNQAMSSVMGAGGGASARANISFGGFYDGF